MKSPRFFKRVLFAQLIVFLCLLVPAPGSTTEQLATETPYDLAVRLQNHYDSLSSLRFNFVQTTAGQLSGRPRRGSGTAYFLKSDGQAQMIWRYDTPDFQVILNDGETVSMYFAKTKQMIITPTTSLNSEVTFSFFAGTGNIMDDFVILPPDEASATPLVDNEGISVLKLQPKDSQSQIATLHIWITADSLMQRLEIKDHFDTTTILNLSQVQENILDINNHKVLDDIFQFTPPAGTEIIRQ